MTITTSGALLSGSATDKAKAWVDLAELYAADETEAGRQRLAILLGLPQKSKGLPVTETDMQLRDDLLAQIGLVLLEFRGRNDKRGKIMRDAAEWLAVLADPDSSPLAVGEVADDLDRYNGRIEFRDANREALRARIFGERNDDADRS